MSMHSLPRVGFSTGSSTEAPSTCRVAMDGASPALFSMADTLALLLASRRGAARGRGNRRIAALARCANYRIGTCAAVSTDSPGPWDEASARNDDGRPGAAVTACIAAGAYLA